MHTDVILPIGIAIVTATVFAFLAKWLRQPLVLGTAQEAAALGGGILSAETGQRFQEEILAVGGSRPALESFKAFRGREPSIDALLRHSGMAA